MRARVLLLIEFVLMDCFMCRLISLFIVTMLIALSAHGEPQLERVSTSRGNAVAEQIHQQCHRLLLQKSSSGGTARELMNIRLERFYSVRGFQPLWTTRKVVDELITAVEESAADGLLPSDYHLATIREYENHPPVTPQEIAQYDLFLTKSFLTLASHLRYGKVDPLRLYSSWNINDVKNFRSLDETLRHAVEQESVMLIVKELLPQDANYDLLKKGLARYRTIARYGGWPVLSTGPTMKPGFRDSRITVLRQRLKISGDLHVQDKDTVSVYTQDMVEAVKRFQKRSGLDVDGSVGVATLRVMNIPVEHRIAQIRVNLERYRWFLHDLAPTCILVNIAGYSLQYLENGKYRWGTRVIVGQPLRETPVFKATMAHIVFNPKWVVPATILAKDVLPALHKDHFYLKKKQLRVVGEDGATVNPDSVNWSHYSATNLPYRLQQRSGDKGALGRIKFLMPNRHTIYLHDTPGKELFDKSSRAFSSGCIRVQNPAELARLVLHDSLNWSSAKIQEVIAKGKTRTVIVRQQIPVFLLYLTTLPSGEEIQFRDDIYNRDKGVLKLLNQPL